MSFEMIERWEGTRDERDLLILFLLWLEASGYKVCKQSPNGPYETSEDRVSIVARFLGIDLQRLYKEMEEESYG